MNEGNKCAQSRLRLTQVMQDPNTKDRVKAFLQFAELKDVCLNKLNIPEAKFVRLALCIGNT